jgi:hypothetical protein
LLGPTSHAYEPGSGQPLHSPPYGGVTGELARIEPVPQRCPHPGPGLAMYDGAHQLLRFAVPLGRLSCKYAGNVRTPTIASEDLAGGL